MTTPRNLIASFVLVTLPACSAPEARREDNLDRRLTAAECTAAVDHAATLLAADPATAAAGADLRASQATAVEQCLATATLRDHQCLMQSRTAHDLGLCPMPGTSGEH